ncbi:MAG: hypothetical protein WBN40_07775, partial [Pseudomonadales bacterium]
MDQIAEIGRWITANESLLSGLAALLVLSGVLLSPLGKGLRAFFARRSAQRELAASNLSQDSTSIPSSPEPVSASAAKPADCAQADPVLAVLPFDNLSSDSEMQFFSDGVSEEIIQRLARGAKLKIIGRTSSFQFRGKQKARAAEQLHCTHVLDGSVQRAAGQVRISAHLTEAASQTTLWSERYDDELADIFALQDLISANIAAALDRTFTASFTESVDPETYDAFLKTTPESYAPEELRVNVIALERITAKAPRFVAAWGRLAYLRGWLHFYTPYAERAQNALLLQQAAGITLALDMHSLDAKAARLFAIAPFGEFPAMYAQLTDVRESPGNDDARRYIGWFLRLFGLVEDALVETGRVYRLDTLNPMTANLLALANMAAGRSAEAIPVFRDLVERLPDMSFPVASLLRAYAFEQDWTSLDKLLALAESRQLREHSDTLPFIRAKREPTAANVDAYLADVRAYLDKAGSID